MNLIRAEEMKEKTKIHAADRERKARIEAEEFIDKTIYPKISKEANQGRYSIFVELDESKSNLKYIIQEILNEYGYEVAIFDRKSNCAELYIAWTR